MASQTSRAMTSQGPCKRVSTLLRLSALPRASRGGDGKVIGMLLLKPSGQMSKRQEEYDDLVYYLWLTGYYITICPSRKRYEKRYELLDLWDWTWTWQEGRGEPLIGLFLFFGCDYDSFNLISSKWFQINASTFYGEQQDFFLNLRVRFIVDEVV